MSPNNARNRSNERGTTRTFRPVSAREAINPIKEIDRLIAEIKRLAADKIYICFEDSLNLMHNILYITATANHWLASGVNIKAALNDAPEFVPVEQKRQDEIGDGRVSKDFMASHTGQ